MGEPIRVLSKETPFGTIACEIISAMSALNMEPMPIPDEKRNLEDENGFLSETDYMAKHAMEHLHATFKLVKELEKQVPYSVRVREKLSGVKLESVRTEASAFVKLVRFIQKKDWVGYTESEVEEMSKSAENLVEVLQETFKLKRK